LTLLYMCEVHRSDLCQKTGIDLASKNSATGSFDLCV
jgi:hypothetical protein